MHSFPLYPWQEKTNAMGVGICGGSNAGKTTLAKALHEYLPDFKLVPEGVREYLKELKVEGSHHRMDKEQRFKFQQNLMFRKQQAEQDVTHFVTDGTSLDIAAYTLGHLMIEQSLQQHLVDFVRGCCLHAQLCYDVLFVCQPGSVPFEHDGVRHVKPAWNLAIQMILEQLAESGKPVFVVHYIQAHSVPDRVAECLHVIDQLQTVKAKFEAKQKGAIDGLTHEPPKKLPN